MCHDDEIEISLTQDLIKTAVDVTRHRNINKNTLTLLEQGESLELEFYR